MDEPDALDVICVYVLIYHALDKNIESVHAAASPKPLNSFCRYYLLFFCGGALGFDDYWKFNPDIFGYRTIFGDSISACFSFSFRIITRCSE